MLVTTGPSAILRVRLTFLKEMEANFDHLKIQFEEVPSTPIKNSLIKPIGLAWRVSDLSKDSFRTFKCHS